MRTLHVFLAILGAIRPAAIFAQATPSPDVFLVGVRAKGRGIELTGVVKNATSRDGYDNQPSWTRDGSSFYYTSTRDDAQADIYRYDVATGMQTRITNSAPESEYSATVTPDGKAISVIRVERDSAQRIWRFPFGGGEPTVLMPALKPAGYHAWATSTTMAVFVLGSPNALVIADISTGTSDTVARNIGRSLHRIPGTAHISFSQKMSDTESWVVELDPATRATTRRATLPAGVEDYAWTPAGVLIAGQGSKLLAWEGDGWQTVGDLADRGLTSITRLAVSPRADWLAVVAVPAAKP